MNFKTIRFKVPALVTVLVTLLFAVNGTVTYINFSRTLVESSYTNAESRLKATVNDVEGYLETKMEITRMLEQSRFMRIL